MEEWTCLEVKKVAEEEDTKMPPVVINLYHIISLNRIAFTSATSCSCKKNSLLFCLNCC